MQCHRSIAGAAMLTAIGLHACASAPATKDSVEPAAQTPAAAMTAAAPAGDENPYPGTTMREGPGGDPVYCMTEVQTGERIARERCYTERAMEQLKESKRDQVEKIRERSGYASHGG